MLTEEESAAVYLAANGWRKRWQLGLVGENELGALKNWFIQLKLDVNSLRESQKLPNSAETNQIQTYYSILERKSYLDYREGQIFVIPAEYIQEVERSTDKSKFYKALILILIPANPYQHEKGRDD
jgi:hypothetical protein